MGMGIGNGMWQMKTIHHGGIYTRQMTDESCLVQSRGNMTVVFHSFAN